jgi:hypothetical protein
MEEQKQQLSSKTETEEQSENQFEAITKIRNDKIKQIDSELSSLNQHSSSPEEINEIENKRKMEYQNELDKLDDLEVSEESRNLIYKKMVGDHIEHAKSENERYNNLSKEKKKLNLYNNLGLGDNAEEVIKKIERLVFEKDADGKKAQILKEALNYYSEDREPIAETPVFHSTGSYGLAKILNNGALESRRNVITGEQATTGEESNTTSFVIGGYDQSEIVSYFYARKNEKQSMLGLDKKDITGSGCEQDIVKSVFSELPQLNPAEQEHVQKAIEALKAGREISDKELMSEKMHDLQERKYYFDPEQANFKLEDLKNKLEELKITGEKWKIGKKELEITKLENRIKLYEDEIPELKDEMTNPFPAVLIYEGKSLPQKDLISLTSGLVSERRTDQPIYNDQLKQIQIPMSKIEKVKEWLNSRMEDLPENSPEREALSKIKIIPLEYIEAKNLIKEMQ